MLPSYRDYGIGDLILKLFIGFVDEKGVEAYLEGSTMGTKLYERWGFITMRQIRFHFENENPTDEWREIVKELEAKSINIMWRPRYGVYEEGKTIVPWEGKPRSSKL